MAWRAQGRALVPAQVNHPMTADSVAAVRTTEHWFNQHSEPSVIIRMACSPAPL